MLKIARVAHHKSYRKQLDDGSNYIELVTGASTSINLEIYNQRPIIDSFLIS